MNFNPEFSRDRKLEVPASILKASARAEALFAQDRVEMADFKNYGEGVAKDIAEVERLKRIFSANENETKPYATALEGVMYDHIERSNWFGENARTIKTSEYDDYKNKCDLIVELVHQDGSAPSPLSLSVDVTFASGSDLEKKLFAIRENIKEDKLGTVKYFKSEGIDFQGELQRVPQVVVGVQKSIVEGLAELWNENNNKALANHPVQRLLLEEIREELKAFQTFAKKVGKIEAATKFGQELRKVEDILAKKKGIDLSGIEEDRVFTSIKEMSREIFGREA